MYFVLTPNFLASSTAIFVIVSLMFYYDQIFKNKFLDLILRFINF
ncbi:membrane protein, putative [Mycoplasma capricolum subsp. capricolum ATCC 27343]|uniref:Membrane protein, putative n=1 Tax=Mycoplasma capricolum subsp. capricolum (strain California kid / ATCC 27343 / NCTC 10154) TaxID=340047 RepID=Q2ST30_MYCCT|nr:membrane protein, putative [Mycoplasma capricolum subsp. capricolum ATCC 27343]